MSDTFAAFSFVDRITGFTPGVRARGLFAVPATLPAFASCLVAEAIGQLAAWVAMAQAGFRSRPVAALAREIRFHADVAPGAVLELDVEIDRCEAESVAYSGRATSSGAIAMEVLDCLGPMLPAEGFDAPEALAERFQLLRGPGAPPMRFRGIPVPKIELGAAVPGTTLSALLHVPAAAPFFADHFPRRPVFPATLLVDAQIGLAMQLAAEACALPAGMRPVLVRMTQLKMRSFIPPGEVLVLDAQCLRTVDAGGQIRLGASANGRSVSTARLEYTTCRLP